MKHKGYIVLQLAEGLAFDKTGQNAIFVFATEQLHVDQYADTLAAASVLVTAAPTTMIPDALSVGTPVIAVPVDFSGPDLPSGTTSQFARWMSAQNVRYPAWRTLPVVWDSHDFKNRVLSALSEDDPKIRESEEFLRFQAFRPDGNVGNRWVKAVSEMLQSRVGEPR
jgi:hypothetical protein